MKSELRVRKALEEILLRINKLEREKFSKAVIDKLDTMRITLSWVLDINIKEGGILA